MVSVLALGRRSSDLYFFFVFYLFLGFYSFNMYTNYITTSTCINIYYTTLLHNEKDATLHYKDKIK